MLNQQETFDNLAVTFSGVEMNFDMLSGRVTRLWRRRRDLEASDRKDFNQKKKSAKAQLETAEVHIAKMRTQLVLMEALLVLNDDDFSLVEFRLARDEFKMSLAEARMYLDIATVHVVCMAELVNRD